MRAGAEVAWQDRVRGSLLGGAIGDALGAPVEFESGPKIRKEHPQLLRTFVSGGSGWPPGTITDDTQMTLFTIEGLIRASVRAHRGLGLTLAPVHHAYDRWLDTQQHSAPTGERDGWLQGEQWLYARRAPGRTCLAALRGSRHGGPRITQYGVEVVNDSKGCGGVMRVAPFGLLPDSFETEWVFDSAATAAGYTHGHPSGKLASGALAAIIHRICSGATLDAALDTAAELLTRHEGHEETSNALADARELAALPPAHRPATIEQLGGGWVAEEALAIPVYVSLIHQEPEQVLDALALAVTHSGDSDSTGAICGNILGALHGEAALPTELASTVEGRAVILQLADDFVDEFSRTESRPGFAKRYPSS
ncbi:ADP-ribosylglycohydrolase family protein [Kribbella antibiotica]|uniref:ADP-ribosylglycohydrolase family protein n=1 Tax=Kribbella antibiotica TaxID=190195 RepID=A0A4R4ZQF5_9ACTN|nr:ADP-ribosylglycohydrolase family protein [Kribbella antibiotica]TDD61191.1 ADP-ribosylglycohydrolase family protein [Kribbella antibiotica]